ncbi:DUF4113 domain-containing protein [Methylobacterium sp. Leaf111]|uniref:DUF4113 domain-containing protein n=1 Tax=Methylobacterium sp. Leaf111 TaxID=1736257 RepID=UPI0012E7971F|nr:DUF4113 domain-containing protein [Methylobacterium sp. Leaf111]
MGRTAFARNAAWGRGFCRTRPRRVATKHEWNTKFEMRTPWYPTRVSDLPVACA